MESPETLRDPHSYEHLISSWFDIRTLALAGRFVPMVGFLHVDQSRLVALIPTPRGIEVGLERMAGSLVARCNCASFRRQKRCEHVCATLLALVRRLPEAAALLLGDFAPRAPSEEDLHARKWEQAEKRLAALREAALRREPESRRELCYVALLEGHSERELSIAVVLRRTKKTGPASAPRLTGSTRAELARHATEEDQALLDLLLGKTGTSMDSWRSLPHARLASPRDRALVERLCATGRLFAETEGDVVPLAWSEAPVTLDLRLARGAKLARLEARLRLMDRVLARAECTFLGAGVALLGRTFHPLEEAAASEVATRLLGGGDIEVPLAKAPDLVAGLLAVPGIPLPELPPDLAFRQVHGAPEPEIAFTGDGDGKLRGELSFWYLDQRIAAGTGDVVDPEKRLRIVRDASAEAAAAELLQRLGLKREAGAWSASRKVFATAARALVAQGWRVLADRLKLVPASDFKLQLSSGIDWFEVEGSCAFAGVSLSIRRVLHEARRERGFVELGNGTAGLLPQEWLERHRHLLGLGEKSASGEGLRFRRSQALLLDAMLAEREDVRVDAAFAALRERIAKFACVAPCAAPPTFTGTLRPYQEEALGWFAFLRELGFSGCLADDMGLGKTVQVLALLEQRRTKARGEARRTSLVVAPRSLVFHWRKEAARFTPHLRVLDCSGTARTRDRDEVLAHDLVLVTYGTLRLDIAWLAEITFDYVVLDESTAIKNEDSQAAKASRLLRAEHRLALSGTPVENHLGELWSLFEFLNPGMLGASSALQRLAEADGADARGALARMLRPFLLRRTKAQVAKDLPERVEETIWCELGEEQRRFYDGVRDAARELVLSTVATKGMAKAMPNILTALLRMRQAACHPRLIAGRGTPDESAKLDELMRRITQVREEGHKALVFSQFTSLLALVRTRLDAEHVVYEYLDGATRDRQARVERFQSDPECELFLISLKAGGLGLNLTAASYVFLLDPWWNPAVEAQAIDRTHRIGQTQRVIAYRLIAKDTVEDRILELQAKKRELADEILGGDGRPLAQLTREDLEMLLS